MKANFAMFIGKGEHLIIAGGNAHWCLRYGNQHGGSSEFGSATRSHSTTQRALCPTTEILAFPCSLLLYSQ